MKNFDLSLYAVSACNASAGDLPDAEQGGATFLQLREKELAYDDFLAKAKAIRKMVHVPFVINDNVEVALACGADGVHVGQSDTELAEARRILGPDKIIGVSCNDLNSAILAERGGADYLGVGAMFSTSTKLDADSVSMNTLRAITSTVKIPVVAIGGISGDNVEQLAGTGIKGCAVVSVLFGKGNVTERTRRFAAKNSAMLSKPQSRRHGLLIDLDGVLLDSMRVWNSVDHKVLQKYGVYTEENMNALIHSTTIESAADCMHRFGVKISTEDFKREVEQILLHEYAYNLPLFPQAETFLKQAKTEGKVMALVTASPETLVLPALKRLRVKDYFDAVFCNVDKTDLRTFYRASEAIGAGIPDTVVYDDCEWLCQVANQGGYKTKMKLD